MAKQPTATAFVRAQGSWANHVAARTRAEIETREALLKEQGLSYDEIGDDEELLELYDDLLFWERYADEMETQRDYIKERYLT